MQLGEIFYKTLPAPYRDIKIAQKFLLHAYNNKEQVANRYNLTRNNETTVQTDEEMLE